MQRFQALATINQTLLKTGTSSVKTNHYKCESFDTEERKDDMGSCPINPNTGRALSWDPSCKGFNASGLLTDKQSWVADQAPNSDVLTDYPSSETESQVVFSNFF